MNPKAEIFSPYVRKYKAKFHPFLHLGKTVVP